MKLHENHSRSVELKREVAQTTEGLDVLGDLNVLSIIFVWIVRGS